MSAGAVHGEEQRDVVIVGAGTAGVSCALECFDIQLDTAVFEAHERPGGQLVEIPHSVRNVAAGTFRDGSALRDSLEVSAAILGDRLHLDRVGFGFGAELRLSRRCFRVQPRLLGVGLLWPSLGISSAILSLNLMIMRNACQARRNMKNYGS